MGKVIPSKTKTMKTIRIQIIWNKQGYSNPIVAEGQAIMNALDVVVKMQSMKVIVFTNCKIIMDMIEKEKKE